LIHPCKVRVRRACVCICMCLCMVLLPLLFYQSHIGTQSQECIHELAGEMHNVVAKQHHTHCIRRYLSQQRLDLPAGAKRMHQQYTHVPLRLHSPQTFTAGSSSPFCRPCMHAHAAVLPACDATGHRRDRHADCVCVKPSSRSGVPSDSGRHERCKHLGH
jgi:hypothetical protein